jgi:nucleotide-binding universal stress UspA family protein
MPRKTAMPRAQPTTPKRLLLATDLLPRCDRALERAVELARRWQAELHVLNVIENELLPAANLKREVEDRRAEAEAMLAPFTRRGEFRPKIDVMVGGAAGAVTEAARSTRADLIVMSPARYDSLMTAVLGSTVDRVLRHAAQPVLIVKRRGAAPYRTILVAVDLSETSAYALGTALRLFPAARFTVVHAYEMPFAGFMRSKSAEVEISATHEKAAATLVEAELARLGAGARRPRVEVRAERGSPDDVVFRRLHEAATDLLVLGTQGITGVRRAVIGSTAERLIETVPCDILAVHPPA